MPQKGDPGTYIAARLKPGDVVIDVGANVGAMARKFSDAVGQTGFVFAVEPDERCEKDLAALPSRVLHFPYIASDQDEDVTVFHKANETQQSSCYRDAIERKAIMSTVAVRTLKIDTITDRDVAAVKIDVQGSEAAVLRGAKRLLRQCPLWVIELWPFGLQAAKEAPESVIDPFVEAGLQPRYLSDEDPIPSPNDLLAYLSDVHSPNQHINVAWVR